ncbi:hypothetical protein [Rhodococcus sp. HS-D2]|uniref:hypothetical protein n=1 Tax=Rhodococcus sp. HS-D2 TaxID=1384636 RepID=UPI000AA29FB2|nr:hypothetical protein [Rhodococcus sp. HS-D2]
MSVRLTPSEHAEWSAALAASPWRSLAHWCREVVADALTRAPVLALDGESLMRDVSGDEVTRFVHLCATLNERAKDSHRLGRVVADSLAAARAVVSRGRALLPTVNVAESGVTERQTELVNVRLTDDEFARWSAAAEDAGFGRVSAWVRHTVAGLLGYELPRESRMVPAGIAEVRRQLAGAVTNCAQLSDLAQSYDVGMGEEFDAVHADVVDLLREYHALGRRT